MNNPILEFGDVMDIARQERIKHFVRVDPDDVTQKLNLIDSLIESGVKKQANRCFNELSTTMLSFDATYRMARLLLKANQVDRAINLLEVLCRRRQRDANLMFDLGQAYFRKGCYTQTLEMLSHHIIKDSTDIQVILLKARTLYALGETSEALAVLSAQFWQSQPPETYGFAALLYAEKERSEQANQYIDCALRLDPEQEDALMAENYVTILRQIDTTGTLLQTISLTKKYPFSGRAWFNLAIAYLLNHSFQKASDAAKRAIVLMPFFTRAWQLKGWCELMLNRVDPARVSFQKAYTLNPELAEAQGNLAIIAVMRAEKKEAKYHIRRANMLNHKNMSGNYAQILMLQRTNPKTAQAEYKLLLARLPIIQKLLFEHLMMTFLAQQAKEKGKLSKKKKKM